MESLSAKHHSLPASFKNLEIVPAVRLKPSRQTVTHECISTLIALDKGLDWIVESCMKLLCIE
jgi:hypothetical protein